MDQPFLEKKENYIGASEFSRQVVEAEDKVMEKKNTDTRSEEQTTIMQLLLALNEGVRSLGSKFDSYQS